jgi:ATP-dependent DNA helicase RecG
LSLEGQLLDQKSLRAVTGKTADWNEIAKDCIAFANATGGRLLLGIEDGHDAPPAGQQIPFDLPDTLRRKRTLEDLIERGAVRFEGNNRWRRYWAVS